MSYCTQESFNYVLSITYFFSSSLSYSTIHTAHKHNKNLSFSSFLQPQIKLFVLHIKTLNPHILSSTIT